LASGEVFAFAGLWDEWTPPEGEQALRTCTIITTTPNETMAPLHHRMPVILAPDAEALWLDPASRDPADLLPLLAPYSAAPLVVSPVSPAVNSPDVDSPQLVLPLDA
jgi:putative SOS response-associated peptidase YedK